MKALRNLLFFFFIYFYFTTIESFSSKKEQICEILFYASDNIIKIKIFLEISCRSIISKSIIKNKLNKRDVNNYNVVQ